PARCSPSGGTNRMAWPRFSRTVKTRLASGSVPSTPSPFARFSRTSFPTSSSI
ncbi:hypothetical protein BGZ52_013105, partial [Haplosporangium bisporale]